MTARNEEACFALARVAAAARTRAAGIRNGRYDDDPMLSQPDAALRSCYFQTFTISCGDDDAWGFAMLG